MHLDTRIRIFYAFMFAVIASSPLRAQLAGSLDTTFNPNVTGSNGEISGIAIQPDGKIIICGAFTTVGTTARRNIARINSDGTIDLTFNPGSGAVGYVRGAALQSDGKIILWGLFNSINGQTFNRVARLNPDGSIDATFLIGTGANDYVYGLALQSDGKIIAVGQFTNVNGQTRNRIVRLNSDGSVESTATFNPGTGANGVVSSVALQADGKIIIGGSFTTLNGEPRERIARLHPDGSLESLTTFVAGANAAVAPIVVQGDGRILIGGDFTLINGQNRNYMARINPDGSVDPSFNWTVAGSSGVSTIGLHTNGKILIGGDWSVGGYATYVSRLNADGTKEGSAGFNGGLSPNRWLRAIALQADGKMIVGGGFSSIAGMTRNAIARLTNDPVTQVLRIPDNTKVQWTRTGALPEVEQVTFELSDGLGGTWNLLGSAVRIGNVWELIGLNLPSNGIVRARARVTGGSSNGSWSIIEQTASIDFVTLTPTLNSPTTNGLHGHTLPVSYLLPEAAVPGSVTLAFDNGGIAHILTLNGSNSSAGTHSFGFDPSNPNASGAFSGLTTIPDGVYSVTLSYQDSLGNPISTSGPAGNVRVETVAPTLNLPPPLVVEAQSAAGSVAIFTVSATDDLDPNPTVNVSKPSGSVFAIGTTTVNVSALDWVGNLKSGSFSVTVRDSTAPIVNGAFTPLTIATGANGMVGLPDYLQQAVTNDAVGVTSVTQAPLAGAPLVVGTTLVTISAKDAAGNTGTTGFTLSVVDGTKPDILAPSAGFFPTTLTTGVGGTISLPDYTGQPPTSDNVGVTVVTQNPAPGSQQAFGTTRVTLTAHDAAGNSRDVAFDVSILDGTEPSIATPPGDFTPRTIFTGVNGDVALPDYTTQAVSTDNVGIVSITQDPLPGSLQVVGIKAVTLVVRDAVGNPAQITFDVVVADGTKPDIAAPPEDFSPLTIVANSDGEVLLPDYTAQALTSDNVGVTGVTQVPAPGSVRLFGRTVVTLTAQDGAGNARNTTFDVYVILDSPLVNSLGTSGGAVPGAGVDLRIPAGASFVSVGFPAVDDARDVAFLAKWVSSAGPGAGIFKGVLPTLLVAAGEDARGIAGARFKTLYDPLLAPGGGLAFTATVVGSGVKASNDLGVWIISDGVPTLVLREGSQAPGLPDGVLLKSVIGLSLRDGVLLAHVSFSQAKGLVTPATDTALLRITPAGTTLLLREGALLDLQDQSIPSSIKTISALVPATGSPSHGRWHADSNVVTRVTLANGRVALLRLESDGTVAGLLASGQFVPEAGNFVYWSNPSLPAVGSNGVAAVVKATLKATPPLGFAVLATPRNDMVLAYDDGSGAGFKIFAREGNAVASVPATAVFSSFQDPIVNANGDVAFVGTLSGKGLTAKNNSGLWWGQPQALTLLARTGDPAPDSDGAPTTGTWKKFTSLALPDGPDAGPVFLAGLAGVGVTAKNNVGLWAVDSTGVLRRLLRTGDIVDGKSVIGIHALTAVPGALGASRGYNAHGTIVARVLFAKGGRAIVRIDIPEGKVRLLSSEDE